MAGNLPPKPLFTRVRRAVGIAALLAQPFLNLNNTTLAAAAPPPDPPRKQLDWPNPSRRGVDLSTHTQQNRQPPEEEVVTPPSTDNIRAPVFTRLYGTSRHAAISSQPPINLASKAPAVVAAPFAQADWPNPQRQKRQNPQYTYNAQTQIIGQDALPFRQRDWPNPRGAPRSLDLLTELQNTQLQLIQPFDQTEWPNPRGPTPSIALRTLGHNNTGYIGQDRMAAGEQEWKNPPLAKRNLQDFIGQNLAGTTLAPVAPQAPFSQDDWPPPASSYARSRSSRQYIDGRTNPNLFPPPPVVMPPNHQGDWPNPTALRNVAKKATLIAASVYSGTFGGTNPNLFPPPPPSFITLGEGVPVRPVILTDGVPIEVNVITTANFDNQVPIRWVADLDAVPVLITADDRNNLVPTKDK